MRTQWIVSRRHYTGHEPGQRLGPWDRALRLSGGLVAADRSVERGFGEKIERAIELGEGAHDPRASPRCTNLEYGPPVSLASVRLPRPGRRQTSRGVAPGPDQVEPRARVRGLSCREKLRSAASRSHLRDQVPTSSCASFLQNAVYVLLDGSNAQSQSSSDGLI